jgi:hypothetical protein
VLYIQLESFIPVPLPKTLPEIKEFMALLYLLALRVFSVFKVWPCMIPVLAE